ncbi:MAG TPA: DUF302 domain-containing protein [Candidatus Acidoferrales bacterium]|nr:DUF302 domain-containing protein [Candidatus Acidoferrales bacterium]
MATRRISVERFSVISSKKFEEVVAKLAAGVGHPDMRAMFAKIGAAKTYADVENAIQPGLGPTGLMEFMRFDHGEVVRKDHGGKAPRVIRFLIGNPLVMKKMVEHVPDAGSYAPTTVLVDERADGVHLTYDTMTSFLETYGNVEAMKVARDLDVKMEALLTAAAK